MQGDVDLRYPVGRFTPDPDVTNEKRRIWIEQIGQAPAALKQAVKGLNDEQFDTPYRPGGWTVRQVVHHVADSHVNAYIRFRWTLTEDVPKIKAYDEKLWAELVDARTAPVEWSLALIDALHRRWVLLLESMTPGQFSRSFDHPVNGVQSLDRVLQMYAWHGRHHVGHIHLVRGHLGLG
jgi:uncharacterized damage-inducible protein DinB